MARFKKRLDYEAELAHRLGKVSREAYNELIEALGAEPDMAKLTPEFWGKLAGTYQAAAQVVFESVILEYLTQRMKEQAIALDWGVINKRAAEWARNYSFELVKGINDNTRAALQQKIAGFYEDKRTLAELKESINELFGPVRAESISITELTRAVSGGEDIFESELNALGLETDSEWETSKDEKVCPICGGFSGTRRSEGKWRMGPPDDSHPRCRCNKQTIVVSKEAA